MADIPEWAKKQSIKNTEIKKIGNQYYLQRVSSKWNKEKKRSQKISGEYLGVLTPEGLIPAKKRKISVDVKYYSKEKVSSLLYSYDIERMEPLCAEVFTGNNIDTSSFSTLISDNGIHAGIVVADKGFPLSMIKDELKERFIYYLLIITNLGLRVFLNS